MDERYSVFDSLYPCKFRASIHTGVSAGNTVVTFRIGSAESDGRSGDIPQKGFGVLIS